MAPDPHPWLKTLPLAPSYHPTPAEFQDPIAYILKIEKEASQFGICKIVPPLPPAPKKLALANLTRSFAARSPAPTFSTRQQQIGFCPRRPRPVQKPVWKSGHTYTLPQFESKAKQFEKTHLKNRARKTLSLLEIESLFWRACADKPFSVEYANDMPGSGFVDLKFMKEEPGNVGESAWNMRGVSRGKGSLLRFMKEEIPGVTSPMVYVAMMFSWFAWHVEDHELHSMNYLHMGAGKTWYGVPRDAGLAFEDVVRVQGYCGEVNPLVTFAILGQKTTVMSPEVLIAAGIPCCRLVQNAGEFVVTFPGAYHTGFSHGFNCGEAANIATPEWLKVAKEAAIKRASTNYPPMVSHFQLLYALALSLCSSMPVSSNEPRSSRLKHKMKGEGEAIVKGIFVENVIQNNDLLAVLLDKGSSCVVLPHNTSDTHLGSGPLGRLQMTVKPRLSLGLCSRQEAVEASEKVLFSNNVIPERKGRIRQLGEFDPMRGKSTSVSQDGKESTLQGDGLLDQGLLSCVTCGILSFACVAVIRPREAAARYLMSADCSLSDNQIIDPGETSDFCNVSNLKVGNDDMVSVSGRMGRHVQNRLDFNLLTCNTQPVEASDQNAELVLESATQKDVSALDLLACAYGDSSDSEEEALHEISGCTDENCLRESSLPNICSTEGISCLLDVAANLHMMETISTKREFSPGNLDGERKKRPSSSLTLSTGDRRSLDSNSRESDSSPDTPIRDSSVSISQRSDKDCSRMHVFCLEHAVEVERQLRAIGGVHIMLVCHPEYPKIEAEAKVLANELGMDHPWKDIPYREATEEAQDTIRSALEDEEAIPMNSDWAVKFGINLYYSASLSKSPLYSKQLPYNQIIYKAFGRTPEGKSPVKPRLPGRRQRRIAVAGRWCGKVWMSNQVHPYLAYKDDEEDSDQKVTPETDTDQADLASPPVRKSGRKRKKATQNSTTKRPKRVDSEESDRIEDGPESTLPQGGRVLRTRSSKPDEAKVKPVVNKKAKKVQATRDEEAEYVCDVEGCSMSFGTKQDLALHKRNVCPVKGCGKKFFSHKYLVQHRKVHMDDRPLKCPWKGCKMTFKWPWARTEHIRVHTGDRPYVCREAGCSQTFRFVSDFSRHKRKTGHSAKKSRR